jgi:cytochrome c-type biogenesis protein CcmF
MATVGAACLILALATCAYGIGASLYGAATGRGQWVVSGRRAVYALALLATAAFAVLEVAFLNSQFEFLVVASHSSTTTPWFYRAAATWSSQEGSLLLWLFLLAVWSSLALFLTRRRLRDVAPYAQAVLLGFGAFFTALLIFAANPFTTVPVGPSEGMGLNPLLRHPGMMIHPPMLYSGYTLFAVPFAFAVGALVVRRVDAEWITSTRRFALAAWFFLGIGIILGARWSYAELGWGGYWAWDPVENASLLPWLTGTAFIHSLMIQEKRGMLKVWNASLVLTTGILAILGTFLVRSGILDSIHAFGASTLGVPFVTLIALMIAGSVYLVVSRRRSLRTEHRVDSLLSREAAFLGNNVVLVGMAFVVFWGTFFPLISEAVTGQKAAVGPPWFDRYIVPLALVLVLLTGVGPVIAWRRATWANARRAFALPVAAAAVTLAVLLAAGVRSSVPSLLMFSVCAFAIAVALQELWRGTGARRAMSGEPAPLALVSLVRRNRRRYGGYLVHVGVAVLFVGVAASSAFQHARDARLQVGQSARVGPYDVRYVRATSNIDLRAGDVERIRFGTVLEVTRGGRHVATLRPDRSYYPSQAIVAFGPVGRYFEGEATSDIGLKAGPLRDVWTAVQPDTSRLRPLIEKGDALLTKNAERLTPREGSIALAQILGGLVNRYAQDPPPAQFRFLATPLVAWIWAGALLVFAGGLIALWPAPDAARRRATAGYAARVARELGRA